MLVGLGAAARQVAAQRGAALVQVLHFGRVFRRLEVRQVGQLVVRDGDAEAIAEFADRIQLQLLLLVGRVLGLAHVAHAVALDGLGQDHGRLAFMLGGRVEGGEHLVRIVAATVQAPDVLVAHARHGFQQLGVLAEEMLAHELAVVGLVRLVLAVDGVFHDLAQDAFLVVRQQRIPVAAPDQLDHVPARTAEVAFQFLDDLAVAAHRTVQALQVAVDDEDQVVELFTGGQGDGAERLGFVHFAVAAEHPDLALAGVGDAASVQVLEEAGLVDGHQRAQAHRHRGELPEVRHQLRMRVRGQALAVHFLAEVVQLFFGQAAFEVGAAVHAGRGVALEVDQVAAVVFVLGVPEVVLAAADHGGQRGEGGDVAAQVAAVRRVVLVGLDHHGHGVPAHVRADARFQFQVARMRRLQAGRNRVDVSGVGRERDVGAGTTGFVDQAFQQVVRALRSFAIKDCRQGFEPLLGF